MKFSTRQIAAACPPERKVSNVTVGAFLRGDRVSATSRAAIGDAIRLLESEFKAEQRRVVRDKLLAGAGREFVRTLGGAD